MNAVAVSDRDYMFLRFAVEAAKGALDAGNIPIAALLADESSFISLGVNARIQSNSVTGHAEIAALENAGRAAIPRFKNATIYCTLSPCAMCTGAILLYQIPRVVVADRKTFEGPTGLLREAGTDVLFADDAEAYSALLEFRSANPGLWDEDNGGQLVTCISNQLLVVTDLQRSISHCRDNTGLGVVQRRERPGTRQKIAWLDSDRHVFRLILVEGLADQASIGPYGHVRVSCADRSEDSELLELAVARDVLCEGPARQPWPICEWCSALEPDRNRMEIGLGHGAAPASISEWSQ